MENEIQTKYRSEEIGLLMGALAKAQGSYKVLIANQSAPGGKFANLQAILQAVRESLSCNGLGFYQYIELQDAGSGGALLKTILGHESGQWVSSCVRVMGAKTERAMGNLIEIHKRIQALLVLGIAPSEGDPFAFDDAGEELAEQRLIEQVRKPQDKLDAESALDRTDVINKEQYDELIIELDDQEEILKDILECYRLETLADLPRSEYQKAMGKIRKIKKTQEEYRRRRK